MRYTKAIVINPPSPTGYVSNKDSMGGFGQLFPLGATYFPPLDLVYLASYLDDQGYPVEILECLGLELTREQLLEKLEGLKVKPEANPSLVLIRTSAPTLDWDLSICAEAKARLGNVRVALFGPV